MNTENTENLSPAGDYDSSCLQDIDAALAEIERTLDQMLILAQVSASDLDVDRAVLQQTLERLQNKIDRIADNLQNAQG